MADPRNMYLVTYSPLVKIFQKRTEIIDARGKVKEIITPSDIVKNRTLLTNKDKFTLKIRRSVGNVIFTTGKLKLVTDPDLRNWLIGDDEDTGRESPTDWTGIVPLSLDLEDYGDLASVIAGVDKPADEQKKKLKELEADAIQRSQERVMRAVRKVLHNLKKQYELCDEQNIGRYKPSDAELLCTYVLKDEEERIAKEREEVESEFMKTLDSLGERK